MVVVLLAAVAAAVAAAAEMEAAVAVSVGDLASITHRLVTSTTRPRILMRSEFERLIRAEHYVCRA